MKKSLCAHCTHCCEIKYDGFMCDITGYLEDKTTLDGDGCDAFEDDRVSFMDNFIVKHGAEKPEITFDMWIELLEYIEDMRHDGMEEISIALKNRNKAYPNGHNIYECPSIDSDRARIHVCDVVYDMMTHLSVSYDATWKEIKNRLREEINKCKGHCKCKLPYHAWQHEVLYKMDCLEKEPIKYVIKAETET